jgi:integrase/recombinase XerD
MKPTDFAQLLTRYLSRYLPGQRNVSIHTVQSYRDTFTLLLRFCRERKGWHPDQVTLHHLDRNCVEEFLEWLEHDRQCSVATRNQRLAALHAFFRFVQYEAPEQLEPSQRILGIPFKRTGRAAVEYLTTDALQALLALPDRTTMSGRRDATLLTLLYDSGARVQELIDLVVRDIRIEAPAVVALTGKGRKTRYVPLMSPTVQLITDYLAEWHLQRPDRLDHPVFFNRQRHKLTRAGVTYILTKYVRLARMRQAAAFPSHVTPHVLRHTKAMHLVQANVNLIYIRDLLGHQNVATTEIYARADAERKREALAAACPVLSAEDTPPNWNDDQDLMQWLRQLCATPS